MTAAKREAPVVISPEMLRGIIKENGPQAADDIFFADALELANMGWTIREMIEFSRRRNESVGEPLTDRRVAELMAMALRRSQEMAIKTDYPDADPGKALRSLVSEVDAFSGKGMVHFGIEGFDEGLGGLLPGECMSLVGAEGSMKTALALHAVEHLLEASDMKILFLSLDMPPEKIMTRRIMRELRISEVETRSHIKGRTEDFQEAIRAIRDKDGDRFRIVGQKKGQMFVHLDYVVSAIESEMPDVLFLDYLTKIQVVNGRFLRSDLDRTQEVIPVLHAMAKEYKIASVWLSQMGRASKAAARIGDHGGHGKGGGIIEETVDVEVELLKDAPNPDNPLAQRPIIATMTKTRRGLGGRSYSLSYDGRSISFLGYATPVRKAKEMKPAYIVPGF